ncbi:helix-turn-helix transcriptional regulator [Methylococcus mesophilus]|uniref:helix-turn-helix transcriptional regulator n=1 Tax=Methylococcus mesophilus TaxID=2993564 RepID=UPI00224B16B3|nr:hypothetical protein [Methylococcus mesophilus]UZR27875.1 hypothetical protein OOT43_14260 [Methylococcus mesophilus]
MKTYTTNPAIPAVFLLPLEQTLKHAGQSRSAWHRDIQAGLAPKPIKLGVSSRWPSDEIDALVRARIAGKSTDEIRELVRQLHEARTSEIGA